MITKSLQNEFWFHVADQSEIPIAGEVGKKVDIVSLKKIIDNSPEQINVFDDFIQDIILAYPNYIDFLRTLVGVSDKRMYLELSYLFAKTKSREKHGYNILGKHLCELDRHPLSFFKNMLKNNNRIAASLISRYLCSKGLEEVFLALKKLQAEELEILIDKWIFTKEVQQAEAKRRGHGAELQLAILLNKLNFETLPKDRHLKPIGKDPNVNRFSFEVSKKEKGVTWSFDLIVMKNKKEHIFVQSLIHTSDPGQYGVNKSDETTLIKEDLDESNAQNKTQKELWGLVDGVGFSENKKDTIDKMLVCFDCFIQLKTIYKAALRLHEIGMYNLKGIAYNDVLYDNKEWKHMHEKYGSTVPVVSYEKAISQKHIPAGAALLLI